jgi:hypothetical protein
MIVLEKIGNIAELIAVILILWIAANVIDWKHNPHHGLQKAVTLMWKGYR